MEKQISLLNIKEELQKVEQDVLDSHPILKYRINQIINDVDVRGIRDTDSHRCGLMLDDSIIAGDQVFQCVIHMREGGKPVCKVGPDMRQKRYEFLKDFDTHTDPICKRSCLDVCRDYNNKYREYHE